MTNCIRDVRIIKPFSLRLLRIFGYMSSAYVLFVFGIDDSLNFFWGPLLAGIGLLSLFIYTKPKRRYYSPVIFTLFYFLGYLLNLAYILLNKGEMPVTGWGSIGTFGFTDSEFLPVVFVIFAGMSGIVTATLIAEKLFRDRGTSPAVGSVTFGFESKKRLTIWTWLWFAFSICLIILMLHLEIARVGLAHKTYLPYKLVGAFYFLRQIFIPFFGILLLDISLRNNQTKLANLILVLIVIIGVLIGLGGVSRGGFCFMVFPPLVYLLFTSQRNNLNKKLFLRFFMVTVIAGALVVPLIQLLRDVAYVDRALNMGTVLELVGRRNLSDFDFFKAIPSFFSFIAFRTAGISELLAVASSGIEGIEIPFKLLMGIEFENLSSSVLYSVYGFIPKVNEDLVFGITYGMWGMLFLSRSYVVVYFGTIFYLGIIIIFEEIFIRKSMHSTALVFATVFGYQVWETANSYLLSRYIVALLFCYLFMLFFLKSMRTRLRRGET